MANDPVSNPLPGRFGPNNAQKQVFPAGAYRFACPDWSMNLIWADKPVREQHA